jgi:plastocyanin
LFRHEHLFLIAVRQEGFMRFRGSPIRLALALGLAVLTLTACDDSPTDEDGVTTVRMISPQNFSPQNATISVGETVRWRNDHNGVQHNTTESSGLWTSPNLDTGQTFSRTFPTAGNFAYECTLHPGMSGTVVVQP